MTAVEARESPGQDLRSLLVHVAELPWPEARTPELAETARTLDHRALVEALDGPGPERLGAIRLLGLLR
jgi:hypothetical protein